jgi:hypothetical protein
MSITSSSSSAACSKCPWSLSREARRSRTRACQRRLRAGEVEGDAAGVAEIGPGARLEILHDGAAVALGVEQLGEQQPALGQLDRSGGVAEPLLEALLDQQLADGDGAQPAVEAEEHRLFLPRPVEQLGEQSGRLAALGGGAGEPAAEPDEQAVPGGVLGAGLLRGGGERIEGARDQLVDVPLTAGARRAQMILDPAFFRRGGLAARKPLERVPIRVTRIHRTIPSRAARRPGENRPLS